MALGKAKIIIMKKVNWFTRVVMGDAEHLSLWYDVMVQGHSLDLSAP